MYLSEMLGEPGTFILFDYIYECNDLVPLSTLEAFSKDHNIQDTVIQNALNSGLVVSSSAGLFLSSFGKKITLLLRTINNREELSEAIRKLSYIDPSIRPYELLINNITEQFIDAICSRTDFIRIYICSPWIRLDDHQLKRIQAAVFKASGNYQALQIIVITLPLDRYRDEKAISTLIEFKDGMLFLVEI